MKTFHYYKMYQSGVSMEIEKLYSTVGINNIICKLSLERLFKKMLRTFLHTCLLSQSPFPFL